MEGVGRGTFCFLLLRARGSNVGRHSGTEVSFMGKRV